MSPAFEMMKKVATFINTSNLSDVSVMIRNDECLAIVPSAEEMFMKYQGWQDYDCNENEAPEDELLREIDIKEERFFEPDEHVEGDSFEAFTYEDSNSYEVFDEDLPIESADKRQRKRSPEWLITMMNKCKTMIGTKEAWSCVYCKKSTATRTGMRMHLLKYHSNGNVSASTTKFTVESTPIAVKSEVMAFATVQVNVTKKEKKYPRWIENIVNRSASNDGSFTCSICKKLTTKTRFGMQLHVTRIHCKSEDSISEEEQSEESFGGISDCEDASEALVKHKRDPEWIKEMVEQSKSAEGTWKCCICHKLTSNTLRGIQIHIIRIHCESKNAVEIAESEDDESEDYESDYKHTKIESSVRREKKLSWAKAMVDKSATENSTWICAICNEVRSKSRRGMLLHIVRIHRKDVVKGKFKRGRKNVIDEAAINKTIEKSKKRLMTLDGNKEILVCFECDNKVFETKEDFRQHIINNHFSVRKAVESEINTSKFLKSEVKRCKVNNEGSKLYRCTTCDKPFSSYGAIRYHLATKHMSVGLYENADSVVTPSQEQTPAITLKVSEMNADERSWFRQCMKNSRTKQGFECCFCSGKTYTYIGPMRYHVMTVHLPHMKKGIDKFDEHLQVSKGIAEITEPQVTESLEKYKDIRGKFLKAGEMTVSDRRWLRDSIKKSRVKTFDEDHWQCWMCKKRYEKRYGTIRYHILVVHLPQWKLGKENFEKHLEDCKNQSKLFGIKESDENKSGPIWKLSPDVLTSLRCDPCGFQFCKPSDFKSHMNIHKVTDPVVPMMTFPKCDLCSMKFRNKNDLTMHMISHSTQEESQIISVEGVPFHQSIPVSQIAFLNQAEPENWTFECGHCPKKFETEVDVNGHILLHHMNPIICPFENREFTRHVSFINHLHSSHAESLGQQLKCPLCKIELTGNLEKVAHLKVCESKQLECDKCGKRFSNRMYLLYHLKKEFGIFDFSCEVCGRSYASRSELQIHLRSHDPKVKVWKLNSRT